MTPAEIITALILGLATTSTLGWSLFLVVMSRLYSKSDLLVSLKASLTYEAIALYDIDHDRPTFVFVADRFAEIMAQLRNPHIGEKHWDYWAHFKESRADWTDIVDRVVRTHKAESRDGDVIVNADASMVVIDWQIGPRFDAGRLWRRPRVCGFYLTHRRSFSQVNMDAVGPHLQAMIDQNEKLQAENQMLTVQKPQEAAVNAIQRLVAQYVPAEVQIVPRSLASPDPLSP